MKIYVFENKTDNKVRMEIKSPYLEFAQNDLTAVVKDFNDWEYVGIREIIKEEI